MIKEKLMSALKTAAAEYNGGMCANAAVAKAAEAADFNAEQTDRLVEMFNTTAAINQFKTASDRSAPCELADKAAVAKILLGDGSQKKASASVRTADYSFYCGDPRRTNPSIEARSLGRGRIMKSASAADEPVPAELDVSQNSLYKVIMGKIDIVKAAAEAADEAARILRAEADASTMKIAHEIEDYGADPDLADMFRHACSSETALKRVSEYSTKVAESDGGRFARMHVFDSSMVDPLLKEAELVDELISKAEECEAKRDRFMAKASEARKEMMEAVGIVKCSEKAGGLADMLRIQAKSAAAAAPEEDQPRRPEDAVGADVGMCVKIAKMIRDSGTNAESVLKLAEDLEKESAMNFGMALPFPGVSEAHNALAKGHGIDAEEQRILNARRAILLAKLMSEDEIIRDADPKTIVEAYKTMVMTAPRVSLDASQVRSFLRAAAGVEAISPNDAKVIADVDRGTMIANSDPLSRINQITSMDSSVKDSNKV